MKKGYWPLIGSKSRMRIGSNLSDLFVSNKGLRQGGALSTLLFNVALEDAMRRDDIQTSSTLASEMVHVLAFADDLDIGGRRHTDVVETYTSLKI